MRTIPKLLATNYNNLVKSKVVSRNDLSEASIKEFADLLNKCQIDFSTEATIDNISERNLYYFIKELYHSNPREFIKFFSLYPFLPLIMWSEARIIMNHFKLREKVYIKWNPRTRLYTAEKFLKKNIIQSIALKEVVIDTLPPLEDVKLDNASTQVEAVIETTVEAQEVETAITNDQNQYDKVDEFDLSSSTYLS